MTTTTDTDQGYYEATVTATFEGEPGAGMRVTSDPTDGTGQIVVEAHVTESQFLGVELTETETEELIATLQAALAYQRAHRYDA